LLTVLLTSPRVAPGLFSWPAWQALRSADAVLAPASHPQLPALDEAEIRYRIVDEAQVESLTADGVVIWLPEPGADPSVPPGAQLLYGSADLPGAHLIDLVATMDRLRAECPWDARQTHESLAPHLLEEPYEALEALEVGDEQAFCEELGDVLLQVVFHARIAAERDDGTSFTVDDVTDGIVAKLVRRHPHVFADVTVSGAEEVKRNWDEIKREEKRALAERQGRLAAGQAAPSALDGVPFGQPALALAAQLQRRAAQAGAPDELARLDGEAGSGAPVNSGEDIGRELFRLVAKARAAGCDPEIELRAAARRFLELVRCWEQTTESALLVTLSAVLLSLVSRWRTISSICYSCEVLVQL
jgi:XTP/dITP diphosphohydrolase